MKIINFLLLCALALCAVFLIGGYGIRYNYSESLPYKIYFSMPLTTIARGQIVDFRLNSSPATFVKMIAGIPGDHIEIRNNKIYINGSEKGKLLNSIRPIAEGVIPDGFFFMLGIHPESFDSRYSEFGLVPQSSIKERLWPIF